ncbi:PREDICTED: SUN domain-containing protein 5 [Chrysochloris asiatica]|uniref:SUN domain-containing protein 5 n=1 Tax=Chrysochloris asiatica TaxID=185453 RepID=A0A9B0THJ7_CHRAS|nr:PREDICTED: SUN domain-containing protein 5 [Chrysochloris asiatica]
MDKSLLNSVDLKHGDTNPLTSTPNFPYKLSSVIVNLVIHRVTQRSRNTGRRAEESLPNTNPDTFLLPVHISAPGLTQCMLGFMSWLTCIACFLRTHAYQVLFNNSRCKLFFQKLIEKTGILILCVLGFWILSIHLPSKMEIWQNNNADVLLQNLRRCLETLQHHTREIQDLRGRINQLTAKFQEMKAMSNEQRMSQKIMKMIQGDYIEKPDFALKSIGASIDFDHTSATYNHNKARFYWNWIRLWNYAQPPDVILEPNVTPGNCWAFAGDHGQVTIRLAQKVYLSILTLQHIPKTISLSGSLDTAPKDFVIYGMKGTPREEEVFLGAFQFQPENTIQMFLLQNQPARPFGAVKVKISSNWGNPRFTCLYRVRVHGSVDPPGDEPNQSPLPQRN